jgi:hypothetical protein
MMPDRRRGDQEGTRLLSNVIRPGNRGIHAPNQRYRPMRGFKEFGSAHRFCRAFDEVRNVLRPARTINQDVSLARRRVIHVQRVAALRDLISAA